MIKVLIFDLDDTLYYEKEYVYNGFRCVCEYLSEKYEEDVDKLYRMALEILDEYGRGKVFNILCKRSKFYEDINNLVDIYRNCIPKLKLYTEAQNILQYAKASKIKLGIITDGCSKVQWSKIKALGLEKVMDKIIVTNDYGKEYNKPHKKSYEDMLSFFHTKPEECVYIGDNPKKDFIGAKMLKINTIRIIHKQGDHINDIAEEGYEADLSITSFNELKTIINKGKKK